MYHARPSHWLVLCLVTDITDDVEAKERTSCIITDGRS